MWNEALTAHNQREPVDSGPRSERDALRVLSEARTAVLSEAWSVEGVQRERSYVDQTVSNPSGCLVNSPQRTTTTVGTSTCITNFQV